MGLRRHRQIAVWSSSPGRPGALGFTWAPRSARVHWCFRTGGLLAVIGLLRVAAAILPRWRLVLAGVVLTTAGVILRNGPASVVMLPGMVFLVAAAFTQTWPEEVRARRRGLERELAAYCTPAQRRDLEATLDQYPDDVTRELRDILAGQEVAAGRGPASGVASRGGGRSRPRRRGPRRPGREPGRPGCGSSGPTR